VANHSSTIKEFDHIVRLLTAMTSTSSSARLNSVWTLIAQLAIGNARVLVSNRSRFPLARHNDLAAAVFRWLDVGGALIDRAATNWIR
jgi:hypothetical protein